MKEKPCPLGLDGMTEKEKAQFIQDRTSEYVHWRARKHGRQGWIAGLIVFGLLTLFFLVGQCHLWPQH